MIGKTQKSHGARCGLYGGYSDGVPPIYFFQAEHRIQFRSCPMRFLDRQSTGAGNFSPHHRVQTGSGAHPASYPAGTRSSFRGG
jgi:hypothetical protein